MGLTSQSTGTSILKENTYLSLSNTNDISIALAGNPNTGKSTLFNALTGLKQHTGNWPGKTVTLAQGEFKYEKQTYKILDLPGTYSLLSNSVEEEVARDFICFGKPSVTVIVTDATCLERNLNLVLQTLEITSNVVLCVNLIDEAKKKGISIDLKALEQKLKIPVVATNARDQEGIDNLKAAIKKVSLKKQTLDNVCPMTYDKSIEESVTNLTNKLQACKLPINPRWVSLRLLDQSDGIIKNINSTYNINLLDIEDLNQSITIEQEGLLKTFPSTNALKDSLVSTIVKTAESLHNKSINYTKKNPNETDRKIDKILISKTFGIPIMLLLLGLIFWLTIIGANYPSELLATGLFFIEDKLHALFQYFNSPIWLEGILVSGIFRTLAWVISVMLPPMAIFFPLFTLLEDLGYLPRIAFNLDRCFKKACAHGKQSLTMCMGFGCNAAGVIGCRIIDSPRERLIAILTNNFVPCNGRFPILISLTAIFIAGLSGTFSSLKATLFIVFTIVLSIFITLMISKLLSKTILKGVPSTFTLELPPYRKPKVGQVLLRSLLDRTLFVLGRAVVVAAPAGIVIWLLANITIGNISVLAHCANFFDPFARLIGLDGYILCAFIIGLPANEIVIPIIIMGYLSTNTMLELNSLSDMQTLFINNGWTWLTAVCTIIFALNHFPCGTTLMTIKKETKSIKWTLLSFLIPTAVGIILCFSITQIVTLLGLL